MELLNSRDIPFLVGGAFAMGLYTNIKRETKDFDLYVRAKDVDLILSLFEAAGDHVDRTHPHWLAKIFRNDELIDVIYRAGNGLCEVDDSWLQRAERRELLGVQARVAAPEELIWMKSFIMERERYDGADVAHLLFSCAERIDWKHLVYRFGEDWRVLLSHLVLFGYIYPSERHRIPPAVMERLTEKVRAEQILPESEQVCRGTILSRAQYLVDVEKRGFRDARLDPRCQMNSADLKSWTAEIPVEAGAPNRQPD
jgi:hypothetical protein